MGGLIAVQMSFLIPTIIWVKLSGKRWYEWSNLKPILFFGWLVFMGLSSVVITVIEIFKGWDIMPRWLPRNQ